MTITYKLGCDAVDWSQLGALYREVGLVAGYGEKGDAQTLERAFVALCF